ncbi:MAG: efflux RND transporter permease subunit, partial [Planctomycetota bacterium]
MVVIAALGVSLIEAFVILPCHLGHKRDWSFLVRLFPRVVRLGRRISKHRRGVLEEKLPAIYESALRFVLRWRYASMAAAAGLSFAVIGLVVGGIIPFVLLQETDAETIAINLEMAAGTPESRTLEVIAELESMARQYAETKSVFSVVGTSFGDRGQMTAADPATVGQLAIELVPAEDRELNRRRERDEKKAYRTSKEIVSEWRRRTGSIPGVSKLAIQARGGGPQGADIEIRVRGEDLKTLDAAVEHIRDLLATYNGVSEIEDDLSEGKLEVRLALKDSARSLGLTTRDLALQIRHALYGFEAQDLQGEEEEVTVRAILPEAARRDVQDLGRLRIATPAGGRVPLEEVAVFGTARGYSQLARVDGKRAVTVTAEVDQDVANTNEITTSLTRKLEDVGTRFRGVTLSFEGAKKETAESIGSLKIGFPVALLIIYGLIAVLFRSYVQPLMVMAAIPYAFVGAIVGHFVMGYPFTILSMIGSVALAGIVVNDSLILVNFINRRRQEGVSTIDAVVAGGRARLRPILLTSITTICGIGPIMLERSFQAQFLIPMAIAICFGLAFATLLTLVLLPTLYLAFEDLRATFRWIVTGKFTR